MVIGHEPDFCLIHIDYSTYIAHRVLLFWCIIWKVHTRTPAIPAILSFFHFLVFLLLCGVVTWTILSRVVLSYSTCSEPTVVFWSSDIMRLRYCLRLRRLHWSKDHCIPSLPVAVYAILIVLGLLNLC